MKSKTMIWRLALEILVLLMTFSAVDMLTSPSDTTASAVQDAVNQKHLQPNCLVEVRSSIHSASVMRGILFGIGIAAILLLGSDIWTLWQSRRRV